MTTYATSHGDLTIHFAEGSYALSLNGRALGEVPRMTNIVDWLPKWLAQWGEDGGIEGTLLACQDLGRIPSVADVKKYMEKHRLTHIGRRDRAAERGSAAHGALQGFIQHGATPDPSNYDGETRGYIASTAMLCEDLRAFEVVLCEQPVASVEYGYAGTPDLVLRCDGWVPNIQMGGNRSKRPKFGDVRPGTFLIDAKTSAQVYKSHEYQLSGYKRALQECGVCTVDDQAVVLIKPNGEGYNWRWIKDKPFLSLLDVFNHEKRPEGWLGVAHNESEARRAA